MHNPERVPATYLQPSYVVSQLHHQVGEQLNVTLLQRDTSLISGAALQDNTSTTSIFSMIDRSPAASAHILGDGDVVAQ